VSFVFFKYKICEYCFIKAHLILCLEGVIVYLACRPIWLFLVLLTNKCSESDCGALQLGVTNYLIYWLYFNF